MFKLKTLLLLSILPLAYLIYHLIGFENGINAYVHKIKVLKSKKKSTRRVNQRNQLLQNKNITFR